MTRRCKDCDPEGRARPAPYPGPRCATHHRARQAALRKARHEKRQQQVYGLAPGEYDRLYEAQGGLCAICGPVTGYNGSTRRLSTDHDHQTGLVRGLLCKHCNDMLGRFRDDASILLRAIWYLLDPPAPRVVGERYAPTGVTDATRPGELDTESSLG